MEHDLEEISDEDLAMKEKEFSRIAECDQPRPPTPSEERIESILKKARAEAVLKDSADFVARGFRKRVFGNCRYDGMLGDRETPPAHLLIIPFTPRTI